MDELKPGPTEFPPQIPWMVRSLLHGHGVKEISVRQAAALDPGRIDELEGLLLRGILGSETRNEVLRWTNGLRRNTNAVAA